MGYHIVNIDTVASQVRTLKKQLICTNERGTFSLPLEDVAAVLVTGWSATFDRAFLTEAGKFGVAVIFCENFKPVSVLLPANRSTDTKLTKATLALKKRQRASLWSQTIDAKCRNQYQLAKALDPKHSRLKRLKVVAFSSGVAREGHCSRLYWRIFGESLGLKSFRREPALNGCNDLLNYGYAVLLSLVLQYLMALGLDPTFGIGHEIRERATPLAYDVMEPFRPCVDWRVAEWVRSQHDPSEGVSAEYKRWVTDFLKEKISYRNRRIQTKNCIEAVIRSLRKAVLEQNPRLYKPWIGSLTKWDG